MSKSHLQLQQLSALDARGDRVPLNLEVGEASSCLAGTVSGRARCGSNVDTVATAGVKTVNFG